MIDANEKRGISMSLTVHRQNDLTGLFDKFASVPKKEQPVVKKEDETETKSKSDDDQTAQKK
jgi:hypothetical protein